MTPPTPEDLVRDFCLAWSRRDADELAAYFTEDAVYHNIPMQPVEGREAIRGFLAGFLALVESAEFRMLHVVAAGDTVMTERVDAFRLGEREGGIPVAGIFEIRDGKIAAWRDYFDLAQVTAVFGPLGGAP
jgi:limonene-1,2-epoxide hydrolase